MFLILLIASLFYVLNLLQKNYLIIIFAPLITWLFLEKRVISFVGYSLIPVLGIFFLVYVTNPENRLQKGNVNAKEMVHTTEKSAFGIRNRMIYVPGKIVAEWFSRIPSEMPFLNGCGYHFAARFMGCEYVNYSKILYEKIYPGYAEEGLRGTVNTASFVYDYANFGKPGLVLSAFVMALLFLFLQWLFAGNWKWLLVFNAFSVVMLSSAALTTLMFSGGWGLRILLFFLFRKQLQNPVI